LFPRFPGFGCQRTSVAGAMGLPPGVPVFSFGGGKWCFGGRFWLAGSMHYFKPSQFSPSRGRDLCREEFGGFGMGCRQKRSLHYDCKILPQQFHLRLHPAISSSLRGEETPTWQICDATELLRWHFAQLLRLLDTPARVREPPVNHRWQRDQDCEGI
jgi:hypothetical protein